MILLFAHNGSNSLSLYAWIVKSNTETFCIYVHSTCRQIRLQILFSTKSCPSLRILWWSNNHSHSQCSLGLKFFIMYYYIPTGVDLVYIVLMFSLSTRKARGYQLTLAPPFFPPAWELTGKQPAGRWSWWIGLNGAGLYDLLRRLGVDEVCLFLGSTESTSYWLLPRPGVRRRSPAHARSSSSPLHGSRVPWTMVEFGCAHARPRLYAVTGEDATPHRWSICNSSGIAGLAVCQVY
jgi:hypothetical protein